MKKLEGMGMEDGDLLMIKDTPFVLEYKNK